ncbi:MAG: glycosyltransferase family 2 protein [Candidatus Aminicenantia bacterium]
MKKLTIVPAYNEEKNIKNVIKSIKRDAPEYDIFVVNDGSTDKTSEIVKKIESVKIVDLPLNLGIGGAVQTGFIFCWENGYDICVQVDGDGQHRPSEIKKIEEPIIKGEADMVIGSRFIGKSNYKTTFLRRLGIKIFYLANRLFLGEKIKDSTSGFRVYNRKAIEILRRYYPDDYPEPEAIFILRKKGLRIKEVGVEMEERKGGRSSITFFRAIYYMIKVSIGIAIHLLRKEEFYGG